MIDEVIFEEELEIIEEEVINSSFNFYMLFGLFALLITLIMISNKMFNVVYNKGSKNE